MIARNGIQAQLCLLTGISILLLVGCANRGGILGVDYLSDIQKGAVPEPVGTKVCQWQNAHIQQASGDQTTLYKADFVGMSETLSPAANDKIINLIRKGETNTQLWTLEPSGDPSLDSFRINRVTQQLGYWGIQNPQVRVGIPTAPGMPGVFAESTFRGLGSNSRNRTSSNRQFNGF